MNEKIIELKDGQLIKAGNNYYNVRFFEKRCGGWSEENQATYKTVVLRKVFDGDKAEELEKIKKDFMEGKK